MNRCDKGCRFQRFPHSSCSELHGHRVLSLSLEFTCTTSPKLPEWRNGRESCEELGHATVLVSTLTLPSKELHISTLLGAPVNDVGDKFGFAREGLGFRRRGAPKRRNDTKRQERPYHVCTGVLRVVDSKDSPTLSVWSFTGIDFSLSRLHHYWPETPGTEKREGIF